MDFRPREAAEGDLTGLWRAGPATFELKRTGADADLDDRDWQAVDVPGHWGQAESLADHDGPILYRRRFRHRPADPQERLWLRFDGVLSGAEIWLDGRYIGDTTTYFAPRRFDVSDAFGADEHLLAVEVSCPTQGRRRNKSSLTGSLQTGHLAPAGNPGGIWRDVAIDSTGPVAIKYSRLLCTGAKQDTATLSVRLVLDSAAAGDVRIDTSVVGPDGEAAGGGVERHTVASGENRIEWSVVIDQPRLWWPAALGDQPRYDVAVAVRLEDGELSDRREWRTGLREVKVDNFIWRVNGRRLFAKGIAYGPADRFLNDTPASALAKDMAAVRDAGLDLVRVYGHISRNELYEETDRQGLLVWQDLPMIGGYSSKVRSAARAMARAAVDELGHHPSVALWCGHCEPNGQALPEPQPDGARSRGLGSDRTDRPDTGAPIEPASTDRLSNDPRSNDPRSNDPRSNDPRSNDPDRTAGDRSALDSTVDQPGAGTGAGRDRRSRSGRIGSRRSSMARRLSRHLLPSWNRSILDPIVGRELQNADRTRPIVARSGSLPSPGDPAGSDAHLWLGWHVGRPEELPRILQRWPRLGAFPGGIGSQSVAVEPWDENAPEWPSAERGAFNRYLPRRAYGDGRTWAQATRAYQADLLRVHIETIRRLKYRPAGGFCITSLVDADPGGGFGVFDHARRPKPAHNVLIDACRPVVVVAEPPPALVVPDQEVVVPVHVISDLQQPLDSVRVTAVAHRVGGQSDSPSDTWSTRAVWQGEVAADSCQWVGDLRFTAPDGPGAVVVDLQLESAQLIVTNRYRTVVIPSSEAIPASRRAGRG